MGTPNNSITENGSVMLIRGLMTGDYFKILCEGCGEGTETKYVGWDPVVPCFKATCRKCGTSGIWKLNWEGLPPNPFNIKRVQSIKLAKHRAKGFKF